MENIVTHMMGFIDGRLDIINSLGCAARELEDWRSLSHSHNTPARGRDDVVMGSVEGTLEIHKPQLHKKVLQTLSPYPINVG